MKKLDWFTGIFLVTALLLLCWTGNVMAEEIFDLPLPGTLIGEGTHFELVDSEYLNVTVDSTEPVKVMLESMPEMVTMRIESASSATSTRITLGGFVPNTTYYKYEDDYHNLQEFITDASGRHTYVQDLSAPHYVFIQTRSSTKFISYNATGGDCTTIGIWDSQTKTCTLTTDLNETIQIDSWNITLDGNGHTLTGSGGYTGNGVYVYKQKYVTIKNLNITNFYRGIGFVESRYGSITGNAFDSNTNGIWITDFSRYNTISHNTITNSSTGIVIRWFSYQNTVENNNLSSNNLGALIWSRSSRTIRNNTFESNHRGIMIGDSWADVYNNNFINNLLPPYVWKGRGVTFNLDMPSGGNYWDDFDTSEEGCNDTDEDGLCDAPFNFVYGVDYLPWTERDGWMYYCDQAPEFEITSLDPEYIWPPNHKIQEVTLSGNVVLPDECTLLGADYSLEDEYGTYTSEGGLIVDADGNFTLSVEVEAWRDGNDKDGRHYSISLSAEDEAGVGSKTLEVHVPHDQRN
jgi:parallel beta-helix repeat protein